MSLQGTLYKLGDAQRFGPPRGTKSGSGKGSILALTGLFRSQWDEEFGCDTQTGPSCGSDRISN